jgi:pimeloyl-ACP methyl ester carboxylesterase
MYKEHYFQSDDGLKLYVRDYSANKHELNTRPVVCLPGLTRNSKDFHKLATHLCNSSKKSYRVISVDYRGRGKSQWDDNKANYNILREAQDVLGILNWLQIAKADFIGTSRGGLILHIIATIKLDIISSIIFNDIGPELELQGLLDIKKYLSKSTRPRSWADAASIQKEIHRLNFPAFGDDDWMDIAKDIYIEKDNKIVADFDPAIANPISDINQDTEVPALWDQFKLLSNIPILTIRGANSSLLSKRIVEKMSDMHPQHSSITMPGQGHPPNLMGNGIEHSITDFLNSPKSPE